MIESKARRKPRIRDGKGAYMGVLKDKAVVRAVSAALMVRYRRTTLLFRRRIRRLPRLSPPTKQNDKYFWRKTIDHNPLFETFCDKTACKEWVRERCGDVIVPEAIWAGNSARKIPDHLLTQKVILKVNKGSGANITINGLVRPGSRKFH